MKELSEREWNFVICKMDGGTNADCYNTAFPGNRKRETAAREGWGITRRPHVAAKIKELKQRKEEEAFEALGRDFVTTLEDLQLAINYVQELMGDREATPGHLQAMNGSIREINQMLGYHALTRLQIEKAGADDKDESVVVIEDV